MIHPSLPWPLRLVAVRGWQVAVYDSGLPAVTAASPPLLLVHGLHAAASAFEMEPLMRRQARHRRVLALDLPGCGASSKPAQPCSPALMCAAITVLIDELAPEVPDIAALGAGCEFAAEAVLARPGRVRSLALISPSGMEDRRLAERYQEGRTREARWLRRLREESPLGPLLGRAAYRLMTQRMPLRSHYSRLWGHPRFDRRLLAQALRAAQAPGAERVALAHACGALSTPGIIECYRALSLPVWVAQGQRGNSTDLGACPLVTGTARGWPMASRPLPGGAGRGVHRLQQQVFDSGALPHWEQAEAFDAAYSAFLAGLPTARLAQRVAEAPTRRSHPQALDEPA